MEVKKLFSMEGKKGFITGAAQGIGECLAGAFAELGAEVAIVDVNIDKAAATAKKIADRTKGRVEAVQCDVTNPESVQEMIDKVVELFGKIDFAINNAGICNMDSALEVSPKDFEAVIDVNLNGVFYTARAAAKQMVEQGTGGSIINTASMSAHIINQPQTISAYCASKAGVMQLTKALAVELGKHNIRVNCVSPGYIQTDLVATMTDIMPVWLSKMPEGSRLGYPEDLVGAYVYLASDASLWANGSDIVVDGGYTIL